MGRLEGKVAFITGAARGQGRSHAVRFAEEGADIIAIDICGPVEGRTQQMGTPEELDETVARVEALGRRAVAAHVDVRDFDTLKAAVDDGVRQLGRLDIVAANAGFGGYGKAEELSELTWNNVIGVNLTGVWLTCKAAIPHIRAGGRGGSIVITSSGAGLKGSANLAAYVSAKTGVIGLMKSLAIELAPDLIRVNAIAPTTVNTPMIHTPHLYRVFRPDLDDPTLDDVAPLFTALNLLPIPWVEAVDISNAILFLSSEEGRYITGVTLPVDAGHLLKPPRPVTS